MAIRPYSDVYKTLDLMTFGRNFDSITRIGT